MPSAKRESIKFSNTKPTNSKVARHNKAAGKQCPNRYETAREAKLLRASNVSRRIRHRQLLAVRPHTWSGSLVDPHWKFEVDTRIGHKRDQHLARYSDFVRLVESSPLAKSIALPSTHYIPFLGKCLDTYDDTLVRGEGICQALQPLFANGNPERHAMDAKLLDEYTTTVNTLSKKTLAVKHSCSNGKHTNMMMARSNAHRRRRHVRMEKVARLRN